MDKALFKVKIGVLVMTGLFLTWPLFSLARDYDYYVDSGASSGGDGSEEDPFDEVADAVNEGGNIFIEDGEYDENLKLKKGTKLFGESEGGVVISGEIKMGDKTALKDLTVKDANETVIVEVDADVEIDNCIIEDFGKIGINALAGGEKLKVFNSKIKDGEGKGFYIQRGKEIELIANEVVGNMEEGIDIRSEVDGLIKDNFIMKNGESGIEVVVGNSDLKIEDNKIKKNGSSGIASQFYPDFDLSDKGDIKIEYNEIEDNDKYGFDCNRPQGGSPDDDYWRDSIELEGNDISGNGIKAISDYCKFIKAVDENEEADNLIDDVSKEEKNEEPKLIEEEKKEIERQAELERWRSERLLQETEELFIKNKELNLAIEDQISEIEKVGNIEKFFMGIDEQKINNLKSNLANEKQQIREIKNLLIEPDWEEGKKRIFKRDLSKIKEQARQQQVFLEQRSQSFSIWGWLKSLFK